MIIIRTPYRISFLGGGTDLPNWYKFNKGSVISTSIQHYSYLVLRKLPKIFDYKYRVRFFLTKDEVNKISDIKHPVVREILKHKKIKMNLDITHHGDLPPRAGIGSSSAFTVGLIHALETLKKKKISKKKLALNAIDIEQNILKENVGSQDQIASSYGGFNKIEFHKNGFNLKKIDISKKKINELQESIVLIYTNRIRNSSDIEKVKIKSMKFKNLYYKDMYSLVKEGQKILNSNSKGWLKDFGQILAEQWALKKNLANSVSNSQIDELHELCLNNGSYGGKILGSGGGGFFMAIIEKNKQKELLKKIKNLKYIKCKFDNFGSQIILNSNGDS